MQSADTSLQHVSGLSTRFNLLSLIAILVALVVAIPIIAVFWIAISGGVGNWEHLFAYVLPRAGGRTLLLLLCTGLLATFFGALTAWLVTTFEFPLRRILSLALVLPLAIPAYLAAYAFGEFFDQFFAK